MQATENLETSIKAQFPLVFGAKDMVSTTEFYQAYNAVADYSTKAADPALKAETHKHQWALAAASTGLIALILFDVGKIRIAGAVVDVDQQVLVWYAALITVMLITFLLRATLDFTRASLARQKDSEKLFALKDLVEAAWAKRNIQNFYWVELFYQIGERYAIYHKATSTEANTEPFKQFDGRLLTLDIESLRKSEDFATQISTHETFISVLLKDLDSDASRFQDRILEYDDEAKKDSNFTERSNWARYSEVKRLYDCYLKPWIDARNNLVNVALTVVDEPSTRESVMIDAQLQLLRQAKRIRQAYAFSEISLPTILAIASIVFVLRTVCV